VEVGADGIATSSPGGLASALSSISLGHTAWVGWAGSSSGRLRPFDSGGARLHPIALSEGEEDRYYRGFANSVLWPLFHGRLRREEMNRAWWRTYRNINERFAVTIARVASPNGTVWVHDYHLLLVPKLLRARRPDLRIGLFLHIPFPNQQLFAMLPWRDDVLAGMLGADLIGFQVADDAANFTATLERLMGASIGGGRVRVGARSVEVDAFPISVDFVRWDGLGAGATADAAAQRARLGVDSIFLGIDRLDYTKGISQRLQAFCELLDDGQLDAGGAPSYRSRCSAGVMCWRTRTSGRRWRAGSSASTPTIVGPMEPARCVTSRPRSTTSAWPSGTWRPTCWWSRRWPTG
jgi:trehalose-6-phosphate synthase